MKYAIGLPVIPYDGFLEQIIKNKNGIEEVYFAWEGMPSGRGMGESGGVIAADSRFYQTNALSRLAEHKIKLNLLLNAACYGEKSRSKAFFKETGGLIEFLRREFGLGVITTASFLIAKFIRENYPNIEIRASVNMEIGTIQGLTYAAEYFDSFYAARAQNRDFESLRHLKKWCDSNKKKLYGLANSGCLTNCPAHTFHDNLVAHENQAVKYDNLYAYTGLCREYLAVPDNWGSLLSETSFIRPEDISAYEGLFEAVKLATRVNPNPTRVLSAYIRGKFGGNLLDLLEPDYSHMLYPHIIDNAKIPNDFVFRANDKDYCQRVFKTALVNLEER